MIIIKKFIKKYYYFLFLFLFIILVILIKNNLLINVDNFVYNFSQKLFSENMTTFMKLVSFFASPICLIGFLILGLLFLKKQGVFLLATLGINQIINELLKFLIKRDRPSFPHLVVENGFSCPSGHTMGAIAFYGVLLLIIWHSKMAKSIKWLLTIFFSLLVIMIMFSRIYLGVHYFSDILAGILISSFTFVIIYRTYHKFLV